MDDLETGMSEDLASILDNEKLMEGQNNQRLKDFFKKLIQTDAQIRKLKQTINSNYQIDNLKAITDRFKRSITKNKGKHRLRPKIKTTVIMHSKKNTTNGTDVKSNKADKRSAADNDVAVTGYVIESKEVVIQYDADKKRNFPKCSHSHEDKTHEKHLKHPYYKHSQRIDEMLKTYKMPDATTENFDVVYDVTDNLNTKPDNDKDDDESMIESITKTTKPETDDKNDHFREKTESIDYKNSKVNDYERRDEEKPQYRRFNDESDDLSNHLHHYLTTTTTSTTPVNDMTDDTSDTPSDLDYNMEKFMSTAPLYDLALSVSTFIDVLRSKPPRNQHSAQRNLLQVDEEDEEKEDLAYDDLKEVLTDEREGHDDMDKHGERKKRDYEEKIGVPQDFNQNKQSPLNIINPNWKGPMPLYPDELNAMIKQAAIQNLYNMHVPVNTRDSKVKRDIDEKANAMSDTQYVEDYSNKKYNKLAKMAQAYSDYGVLYKKENFDDMGKKSAYMKRLNKLFSRQKPPGTYEKDNKPADPCEKDKPRPSEGFKFEIRQGSPSNRKEFSEGFQKYIKLSGNRHETHSTTLSPISVSNYEFDKLFTPINLLDTTTDVLKTTNLDRCLILTFKKGGARRTLKSIDMAYEDNYINEAIALNLDEVNDTIKEILNLTNLNITDSVYNEMNSLNSYEGDDKINATNSENLSEDGDIITETLALNLTTEENIDMINKPILMKLYEVNSTRNGTNAQHLTNNEITNVHSSNFTIRKSLRALKFIDIIDDAIIDRILEKSAINLTKTNVTNKNDNSSTNGEQVNNKTIYGSSIILNLDEFNEKIRKGTQKVNETKATLNNTTDGIISFISMMSDWFRTIASLSGEMDNKELKKENNNSISNLTTSRTNNKYLEENRTRDILYPSYDVEMVDNIGHRSRVLLSFDESTEQDGLVRKQTSEINYGKAEASEIDDTLPIALVLASNETTKTNKTVNKREKTLDENIVFWNDLYDDDEYGVKLDYMDNVRDKHSVKAKNILNKSREWLAEKCSNVRNKLRKKPKTTNVQATTASMGKLLEKSRNETLTPPADVVIKEKQRFVRSIDHNGNKNIKQSFAALTANMKKVCQEAARAIQDTKNIEVRENSQEHEAATSLMQNLVRMMSELVDIQVQQKTCAKLPSDLYNFLEWLTAPNDDKAQVDDWPPVAYDYNEAVRFVKSTELNDEYPSTLAEDFHQGDRTECLGTIRAVQDLIQQYEGMTDEDKSKMTGVKQYLENQLLYLNNKLNNLYDPNPFKLYGKRELRRKRRDTSFKKQDGREEAIANNVKSV